jgi:hypothetical protein
LICSTVGSESDVSVVGPRRSRRPGTGVAAGLLVAAVAVGAWAGRLGPTSRADGDPGRLTDADWSASSEVPDPELSDATAAWALGDRPRPPVDLDEMAGGLASVDLDLDGDLDLVVAQGTVDLYLWETDGFATPRTLGVSRAVAVTAGDVDRDGWPDLMVARDGDHDIVIWGGEWIGAGSAGGDPAELAGTQPSAGLIAAELSGDGALDIVRLGRGEGTEAPDIVWTADPREPRSFVPTPLGNGDGPTMAAEIADIDGDGLLDIWATRDVGWDIDADSLYSRRGDPTGPWFDIAAELGADLAIDGMGVTIADLDGDGSLDAYISDLGDNEVLLRDGDRFVVVSDTGAARIRPPGAATTIVSSSWASGATDVNLDGRLDLVVANGGFASGKVRNKIPGTAVALIDPPAVLVGIGGGRYVDTWSRLGLRWDSASRGLTIADFDADGDDDYVFISVDGSLDALRNDAAGSSITIAPGPGCHPGGAVVTVDQGSISARMLLGANTYAGAHSTAVVVGMLPAIGAITVVWPGAHTSRLSSPRTSGRIRLTADCADFH